MGKRLMKWLWLGVLRTDSRVSAIERWWQHGKERSAITLSAYALMCFGALAAAEARAEVDSPPPEPESTAEAPVLTPSPSSTSPLGGRAFLELGGIGMGASNLALRGDYSIGSLTFGIAVNFPQFTLVRHSFSDLAVIGLGVSFEYHPWSRSPLGPYAGLELGSSNLLAPTDTFIDTGRPLVGFRLPLWGGSIGGACGVKVMPAFSAPVLPFAELTIGIPLG